MSYREVLSRHAIAISTSESPDMPALGLSDEHLQDATTEIARHLLALGAKLVYGGDLRAHGFSELLFELVARYRRDLADGDEQIGITNYLAWPVHISRPFAELEQMGADLKGSAELVCLRIDGTRLPMSERRDLELHKPSETEWELGLTAMRKAMLAETDARIVLGGRVEKYKGIMPGIAEEALLSLLGHQPLFLMGGFGGCARDIAESAGLAAPWARSSRAWPYRDGFQRFSARDLNNGLTDTENTILAETPHVDQAVTLILRGLLRDNDTAAER